MGWAFLIMSLSWAATPQQVQGELARQGYLRNAKCADVAFSYVQKHHGKPISRESLAKNVWSESISTPRGRMRLQYSHQPGKLLKLQSDLAGLSVSYEFTDRGAVCDLASVAFEMKNRTATVTSAQECIETFSLPYSRPTPEVQWLHSECAFALRYFPPS